MNKRIRKKKVKKQDNVREAMTRRIKTLESEKKMLMGALNETNLAVNALLASVVIFHGQAKDADGKEYSLTFPRPNIECPFKVTTSVSEDRMFYTMTAKEVEQNVPEKHEFRAIPDDDAPDEQKDNSQ